MAVVNKLSLDVRGAAIEVKISLDKKTGIFKHDLSAEIINAVKPERVPPFTQLRDIEAAVKQIVKDYNDMATVVEHVILTRVITNNYIEGSAQAKSVALQFAHVRKVTIGSKVDYYSMWYNPREEQWSNLGNKFYTGYSADALKPEFATHIPFTQENYDKLMAIKNALDKLGNQLTDMLSQDKIIPALAAMNTNLNLLSAPNEEKPTLL